MFINHTVIYIVITRMISTIRSLSDYIRYVGGAGKRGKLPGMAMAETNPTVTGENDSFYRTASVVGGPIDLARQHT